MTRSSSLGTLSRTTKCVRAIVNEFFCRDYYKIFCMFSRPTSSMTTRRATRSRRRLTRSTMRIRPVCRVRWWRFDFDLFVGLFFFEEFLRRYTKILVLATVGNEDFYRTNENKKIVFVLWATQTLFPQTQPTMVSTSVTTKSSITCGKFGKGE